MLSVNRLSVHCSICPECYTFWYVMLNKHLRCVRTHSCWKGVWTLMCSSTTVNSTTVCSATVKSATVSSAQAKQYYCEACLSPYTKSHPTKKF